LEAATVDVPVTLTGVDGATEGFVAVTVPAAGVDFTGAAPAEAAIAEAATAAAGGVVDVAGVCGESGTAVAFACACFPLVGFFLEGAAVVDAEPAFTADAAAGAVIVEAGVAPFPTALPAPASSTDVATDAPAGAAAAGSVDAGSTGIGSTYAEEVTTASAVHPSVPAAVVVVPVGAATDSTEEEEVE
jgi:hypothetical protein